MYEVSWLLAMSVVIVVGAVALVVGVERLNHRTGLGRSFLGEVLRMLTWILPEILIASYSRTLPGPRPDLPGDSYIAVGAVMGGAAANVLLIGILNTSWPGRGGLEANGPGDALVSAAVVLLVACVSFVGLVIGAGPGVGTGQVVAGVVVTAVFLLGLRLVHRQRSKSAEPEPLFHPGGGDLVHAIGLTGSALIALVYGTPFFTEAADRAFRATERLPGPHWKLLGLEVVALGLLMAVPDAVLSLDEMRRKAGGSVLPRLFLGAAAMLAFTAVAGLDPDTLRNGIVTHLFGAFGLLVSLVAVIVVLYLATRMPRSPRLRGLIIVALVMAGIALSIIALDIPPV